MNTINIFQNYFENEIYDLKLQYIKYLGYDFSVYKKTLKSKYLILK